MQIKSTDNVENSTNTAGSDPMKYLDVFSRLDIILFQELMDDVSFSFGHLYSMYGFFCLAIIKGPPNDIYCTIEKPSKHYFTEKVSYSRNCLCNKSHITGSFCFLIIWHSHHFFCFLQHILITFPSSHRKHPS